MLTILIIELIFAVITIIMACIYSKNIGYATAILTAYITFSAILIKLHISSIIKNLKLKIESNHNIILKISDILIRYNGARKQFAIVVLENAVESIEKGEMKLNTDDYFRIIRQKMKNSKNCKIYAICCIEELLNQSLKGQKEYIKANIEATTNNNVTIHRKFVLPKNILETDNKSKQLDTIYEQWKTENIIVGIIDKDELGNSITEDWVLFSHPYNELFISIPNPENVNKIESAKKVVNERTIEKYIKKFDNYEEKEWREEDIEKFFTAYQNKNLNNNSI